MDILSPNQFKGVSMNNIPVDEDLVALNNQVYDRDNVVGKIMGEIVDERCKDTKILCNYWDKRTIYVIWATKIHSFDLFVVPIVTPSSEEDSIWKDVQLDAATS